MIFPVILCSWGKTLRSRKLGRYTFMTIFIVLRHDGRSDRCLKRLQMQQYRFGHQIFVLMRPHAHRSVQYGRTFSSLVGYYWNVCASVRVFISVYIMWGHAKDASLSRWTSFFHQSVKFPWILNIFHSYCASPIEITWAFLRAKPQFVPAEISS